MHKKNPDSEVFKNRIISTTFKSTITFLYKKRTF